MGNASAKGEGRSRLDLGNFSICVLPTWKAAAGAGIDSAVGRLTADGIWLSYDFGLNSDPLAVPPGATGVNQAQVSVAGLAARRVSYTLQRADGGTMHYLGFHVPEVRRSSMGWLKLTLLAYAQDQAKFAELEAAVATVQFKPAPAR